MKILKEILFKKVNNIHKRTYFWNLVANIVYSLQSAMLLVVVTRFGNLTEAGIFSIIYTTTHMLSSIGNYNMRNYQVSDARNEYSFQQYWSSRVISCIFMCVVGCAYALTCFDAINPILIVLCFVGYRVTDGIEDVVHGYVQKVGRLDIASYAKAIRIILSTLAFCIVYMATRNLLIASFTILLVSILVLVIFTVVISNEFVGLKYCFGLKKVGDLLLTCLPICVSALLQNYIVNSPKYAIDSVLSAEAQAIFNILFMPIFAINVLSIFVFNPLVADMGKWWQEGEVIRLINSIIKQTLIVLAITILTAMCGYFFGCEILGAVYGINLTSYKILFMILLLFGGIAALATFMSVIVTIMRKQNYIIIAYAMAGILSVVFSNRIVAYANITGAAILYGLLMSVVFLILTAIVVYGFIKADKSSAREC